MKYFKAMSFKDKFNVAKEAIQAIEAEQLGPKPTRVAITAISNIREIFCSELTNEIFAECHVMRLMEYHYKKALSPVFSDSEIEQIKEWQTALRSRDNSRKHRARMKPAPPQPKTMILPPASASSPDRPSEHDKLAEATPVAPSVVLYDEFLIPRIVPGGAPLSPITTMFEEHKAPDPAMDVVSIADILGAEPFGPPGELEAHLERQIASHAAHNRKL